MVNKFLILFKSSFKKSLKQILAVFLLSILVSLLFNILFTITLDYKNNFRKQASDLNCSTFTAVYYNFSNIDCYNNIENNLKNNDLVTDYEIDNVISNNGIIDYGDGLYSNIITIDSIENIKNKKIDKCEFLQDSDLSSGVYVSYIFNVTIGKEIGDTIKVKINNNEYNFTIIGFYNSMTTGTINCTDISVYVTNDIFDELYVPNKAYRLSVNLNETATDNDITKILESISFDNSTLFLLDANVLNKIEVSRYTNSSMFEAIMIVACVILCLVLLCIITIVLTNYVKTNVKNFGTLKACGYTSNILIYPLVIEFALIVLIASIIGVLLSFCVLPIVNISLEKQVGIPYEIHFLWVPFILSVSICVISSTLTTYLSILKIRKIAPINAIRENKTKTSKIGNVFNFEKSKLNINCAIGLNTLFSGIKRSLILFVSFVCISFLLGFSTFVYQNVVVDNDPTINLVCGQVCNAIVSIFPNDDKNFKEELSNNSDVDSYYLYTYATICPKNLAKIKSYVIEKDCEYINTDLVCLEGKMPYNDNEIAINGAYAKVNNLKINDSIYIEGNEGEVEYKIVGITQGAYFSGLDSYMTKEGYNKVNNLEYYSYYINIKDSNRINSFLDDISIKFNTLLSVNQDLYLDSIVPLYCLVLNILGIVIVILSVIISIFVLYVLLSIMLDNKRREHGILKSLGFTSNNILVQTIVCIIPVCILGIIVGLLLSKKGSGNLITMPLKSIGIFNFNSDTNGLYLLIVGVGLSIFTLIIILILSRSIKKITPHQLFNRE